MKKRKTPSGKSLYNISDKLDFGKYKNQTIKEVLELNPDYIIWANKTISWFTTSDSTLRQAYKLANERLDRKFKRFNNRCFSYYHSQNPEDYDTDIYGYSIWD